MSQDADLLERIDVRWKVVTKSAISTPQGDATVEAGFLMTLGTYAGDITRASMADNINARGVYDLDIVAVVSANDTVTMGVASEIMRRRGVLEEDIVEMAIAAVLVDDRDVAASVFASDS